MADLGNVATSNNYDVIVVGTGPGGATVARDMAKKGKKVLMLEWGPNNAPNGGIIQTVSEMLIPFRSLLLTPQILGAVRGICTGGSSIYYYGTSYPIPFEMFKAKGVDLKEADNEIRKDLPFIGPLKEHQLTTMAKTIRESAQDLGYDWKALDKYYIQDRWTPDYGWNPNDPRDIKWSALHWVREALLDGATLLNHAKVSRVILENKKAVGVEFKMKGNTFRAYGSTIVLAAGGIGTPVILRNTGIKDVGYDFFFDPLITVCGEHKHITKNTGELPMQCGCPFPDDEYLMTDMAMAWWQENIFSSQVFRFDQLFKGKKTFRIMVKSRDALGGRLTNGGQVLKMLGDKERKKLKHGGERARKILEHAGCHSIYKTYYFAAHPGGTVKLGEFVDSNLKTQYDNLYVCDCSVIPEAWGKPPVQSILAMGRYLSKILAVSIDKPTSQVEAISGKQRQAKVA
jgi:choline dehydrogenase-like flavoprotein